MAVNDRTALVLRESPPFAQLRLSADITLSSGRSPTLYSLVRRHLAALFSVFDSELSTATIRAQATHTEVVSNDDGARS
ncbi:MAG: hypothetical protein JWM42_2313 [Burkholderia sp.]|nr:hypothetical protein [Burkholderia sp.]